MKLNELSPAYGATKKRKRVGVGYNFNPPLKLIFCLLVIICHL